MKTVKGKVHVRLLAGLLLLSALSPAAAEDVEKRFRIGVAAGFFNGSDEVPSAAANDLVLLDESLQIVEFFTDPRDDSSAFGNLEIQPGATASLFAQYAVNKIFLVEASLGYQKTDVGDVEVQAQFDGVDLPELQRFLFRTFRIPVGELERVPLQVTGLARFRPRTSFNPYVGGGIGYTFVGLDIDPEFDALSRNLDASRGGPARLTSAFLGNPSLIAPSQNQIGDLEGARVDARDTWEWHIAGGVELSFKRHWVVFLDFRQSFTSRNIEIGFNGGGDLGVSVPNTTDFALFVGVVPQPDVNRDGLPDQFGAVRVSEGGLVDGGSLAPEQGAPPDTDCAVMPALCTFDFDLPDGQVDTGLYYVQGGQIAFDGFSAQVGVRYTF